MITKPMLASKADILSLTNTYIASPKIDGIRALRLDEVVSRSFKLIRNIFIRNRLMILPKNSDGEIICGNFQQTTSGVMTENGCPDFTYYWFDYVTDLQMPYYRRLEEMRELAFGMHLERIVPMFPGNSINGLDMCRTVTGIDKIEEYESECLEAGYEGLCLRLPDSPYKCGRSTPKEQYLIKLKRFSDSEAIVLGFKEEMMNNNETEKDNFGYSKKSTSKDNLVPQNTLGSFVVRDIHTGVEFDLPARKGLSNTDRRKLWNNRENLLNKIVKYSYFPKGVKEKPRHPQFLGFRDKDDLS